MKNGFKAIVFLAKAGIMAVLAGCTQVSVQEPAALALAQDGNTAYRIVISAKADVSTKAVVEDMAAILKEITGAVFPVVSDTEPPSPSEIVVGHDNARLADLNLAGMTEKFATDEYEIRSVGTRLVIAGAPPRGSINGMYGFLQDHLGCRWFTPAASRIPKNSNLTIGSILDRQKPAFLSRLPGYPSGYDPDWAARNRVNQDSAGGGLPPMSSMDQRLYSMLVPYGGHALHYIPASLYDEHPEYYAEIGGKRIKEDADKRISYCISNSGFVKYVAEWGRTQLRAVAKKGRSGYPPIINLGMDDTHVWCQCAECKASYERLGKGDEMLGVAATYHEFYNKVAEEIAKEIPEFTVDFIAYIHIAQPSQVKMHPNIQVTWCPMGACQAHAFDENDCNRDSKSLQNLDKWCEQTHKLRVWYYHYQEDPWMPSMKLFATQPDFKEFRRRGVQSVFVQGTCFHERTNLASDGDIQGKVSGKRYNNTFFTAPQNLGHLIAYITVQLLWNPDFDVRRGITEFCATYYGAAAEEMEQLVVLLESVGSYERTVGATYSSYPGVHQSECNAPMLKWSVVEKMDALFDRAEKKVAADPVLLRRVQMLRLTHQLGILCYAPADNPLRKKAFDAFFPLVEELGIITFNSTGISGARTTPAQFKALVSDPKKIVIPGQEKVGANLLENSGFEIATHGDGIPDGWSAQGRYMPEEYELVPQGVAVDTTKAYAGKASVRLTKEPSPGKTVCLRQRFDAKPGSRYRMTLRYQAEIKAGGLYVIFTALGKDGKFLRHQEGTRGIIDTKGEWRVFQVDTTARDDTAGLMVEVLFYDDKSEGVAWVDDFTCTVLEK